MLHFVHVDGYPPRAYQALLGEWTRALHVVAIRLRPPWPDPPPFEHNSWGPFVEDLLQSFTERQCIRLVGVGHSLGATPNLRSALQRPGLFAALVLIDPVLFPQWMNMSVDISTGPSGRPDAMAAAVLQFLGADT